MNPMFDLQAAKSCVHMFESLHAYPTDGGWNLYLRFTDTDEDSTSGILVKSRTIEPKLYKTLETIAKDADTIGFNAFEVHLDGF